MSELTVEETEPNDHKDLSPVIYSSVASCYLDHP